MPDNDRNKTKRQQRNTQVGKTGAARKDAEQILLGEAALQDAVTRLRQGPDALGPNAGATGQAQTAGNGATQGQAAQSQTIAPKTVSQVLGEIVWLMTQSPRHKAIALGDLEWLVMPAILLQQFRIFYKGEQPVGCAIWALADDIVAKRIDAGDKRLTAAEWKSGGALRIIDIVAPFGGEAEMREKFAQAPF